MCDRIETGPPTAISLPDDIAVALPALIDHHRSELAPARDVEIIGKLVEICALIGMGVGQKEKTEWQAAACMQLTKLPRGLMLEGLGHAAETCDRLSQVVKSVFDYAEGYPDRMRVRLRQLETLQERSAR